MMHLTRRHIGLGDIRLFFTEKQQTLVCELGNILINMIKLLSLCDLKLRRLGSGVSLLGSLPEPQHSILVVLGNTLTSLVHHTTVVLGTGVALLRSLQIPFHGLLVVFGNTLAVLLHHSNVALSIG